MFQWILPAREQKQFSREMSLLYFANSAVGTMLLPPRVMHAHEDRVEITFVSEGSGTYIIDNRSHKVRKGDIVIVEPGRIHDEKKDTGNNLTVFCLGVTGIRISGLKRDHLLNEEDVPVLHTGRFEPHFHSICNCMFEQLLLKKQAEALNVCNHLLEALIALILELPVEKNHQYQDETEPDCSSHIKFYIDQHYHESCSLDEMADRLNMSTSYLAHTFKASTGYSPGQYMIWRRIGEAQTLLCITKHPVTQVATMVGYDNTNYFSSLFKKIVSMKPKEYREYWLGKEQTTK